MNPVRQSWFVPIATWIAASAAAQVTELESQSSTGVLPNSSCQEAVVSADGRYVAFRSPATTLTGDPNFYWDVFVRDRLTATTERVSVGAAGEIPNGNSAWPADHPLAISGDGRFVAFPSQASNLVAGDTNGFQDIFVRDRLEGTTERVSVGPNGEQANHLSEEPALSADGRFVAFKSFAALLPEDANGWDDVYLRDRQTGALEIVSVTPQGAPGNANSSLPTISADGRFVAFESLASDLVAGDTNATRDVFVRDRVAGTTRRVSVSSGGVEGNAQSHRAVVSADGTRVAFESTASNLDSADPDGASDIFVHDLATATTAAASIAVGGGPSVGFASRPSISADGRFVSFDSSAPLAAGDVNGHQDVFVRDTLLGATEIASVATEGTQGADDSRRGAISLDGRYVVFQSFASNLSDQASFSYIFLHDRDADGFATSCEPGVAGVIACPCGNPPAGPDRGCDNSAASGGAVLSASGIAYLSSDTLLLRASGETASATSILLQGSSALGAGAVFGQGVRCVGGTLLRLYVDQAVAGSVIVPDAGDPSVSARSAALGDPLAAGATRYYLMYYRDPVVLGGCPATSTFNATQTGSVTWWP